MSPKRPPEHPREGVRGQVHRRGPAVARCLVGTTTPSLGFHLALYLLLAPRLIQRTARPHRNLTPLPLNGHQPARENSFMIHPPQLTHLGGTFQTGR